MEERWFPMPLLDNDDYSRFAHAFDLLLPIPSAWPGDIVNYFSNIFMDLFLT